MNPKPFLDALPSVTSPYTLSAFILVIVASVLSFAMKAEGQLLRIIEKKLTRLQAFKLIKTSIILCFSFALATFVLGYILELVKIINVKSEQTSIVLFDSKYDITDSGHDGKYSTKAHYISFSPAFTFPGLSSDNWETPKWIQTKEELIKYMKISAPKDFDPKGPFFEFLEHGKALFVFGKKPVSLVCDSNTNLVSNSPFAETPPSEIFQEPFSLVGRNHIVILSIPKNGLHKKFQNTSPANLLQYYLSNMSLGADQVLSTRSSAVFIANNRINNAIFQGERKDINIFTCGRFLETEKYFFAIEAKCYAPEMSPKIASDITECIFRFRAQAN